MQTKNREREDIFVATDNVLDCDVGILHMNILIIAIHVTIDLVFAITNKIKDKTHPAIEKAKFCAKMKNILKNC